jgi:hypothetical protein
MMVTVKYAMSENEIKPTPYKPGLIVKIFLAILIAFATFYGLMSIFYPVEDVILSFGPPTLTPTMTLTVEYSTPTPVATFTPTITVTPTITSTPFPASSYLVVEPSEVRPEIPVNAEAVYIIDNLNAEVNPPFDHFQWTSSDTIGADIGREFNEAYFATFGAGSIQWSMDQDLPPALYEVFILDTLYSSGGYLNFTVQLNEEVLQPLVGKTLLQYNTTQSEPPQYQDQWRSIGIFDIQQIGRLSIATEWGNRDELSIVAVDRVMIVRQSDYVRTMLANLPNTSGTIFLIDDEAATFSTDQYWKYWEDEQSWGGQYQVMSEPPLDTTAAWQIPSLLPHGDYEAYAWIPKSNATIPVTYELRAGGLVINNTNETSLTEFPDGQGSNQPGRWIKLGEWIVPEYFGNFLRIEIVLNIPASDTGEVVIDTVAIIQKPLEMPEE